MDVTFYTLDFSERLIMPPTGDKNGYISITAIPEFRGKGSFQLNFNDEEVERFVKEHPEGYLIKWGLFEGYGSDYQFIDAKQKNCTLYGLHLNGLMNKAIFPPQAITAEEHVGEVMGRLIAEYFPWIVFDDFEDEISGEYTTDDYMEADKFIEEYFAALNLGYKVYIRNKKLHFKILSPIVNPIVFSKNNLNVYEIQEDFSNRNTAFGGWYKKSKEDNGETLEEEEWIYITSADKEGIYKRDIILSATSPSAARQELESHKDEHAVICKINNVKYGTDYNIGDVVRMQLGDKTIKKQITSVDMWHEGATYHEEPKFEEWEE